LTKSLKIYSDAGLTVECATFIKGNTIYVNGEITSHDATTDSTVLIQLLTLADAVVATLLNTTYSFAANTVTSITTINGAALSYVLASNPATYKVRLTVSDAELDTGYDEATFEIITTKATKCTIWIEDSTGNEQGAFKLNDVAYWNGTLRLNKTLAGVTVSLSVTLPKGQSVNISNTTWDFTADTDYDLIADIFATASQTRTLLTAGDYQCWLGISKSNYLEAVSQYCWITVPTLPDLLSNPAISDATITQDVSVDITATLAATVSEAVVKIKDAAGVVICTKNMSISGGVGTATIEGWTLPIGTYSAGQIEIYAADTVNYIFEMDESLSLVVSAGGSGFESWFRQSITLEPFSALDDYGAKTYGSPVEVACRIAQKDKKVRSASAEDIISTTQIYISGAQTVTVKDRITLPDNTQPVILEVRPVKGATGTAVMKVILT